MKVLFHFHSILVEKVQKRKYYCKIDHKMGLKHNLNNRVSLDSQSFCYRFKYNTIDDHVVLRQRSNSPNKEYLLIYDQMLNLLLST